MHDATLSSVEQQHYGQVRQTDLPVVRPQWIAWQATFSVQCWHSFRTQGNIYYYFIKWPMSLNRSVVDHEHPWPWLWRAGTPRNTCLRSVTHTVLPHQNIPLHATASGKQNILQGWTMWTECVLWVCIYVAVGIGHASNQAGELCDASCVSAVLLSFLSHFPPSLPSSLTCFLYWLERGEDEGMKHVMVQIC